MFLSHNFSYLKVSKCFFIFMYNLKKTRQLYCWYTSWLQNKILILYGAKDDKKIGAQNKKRKNEKNNAEKNYIYPDGKIFLHFFLCYRSDHLFFAVFFSKLHALFILGYF